MEALTLLNCSLNQQIFEILGNMKKLKVFAGSPELETDFPLFIGPQGDALVLHVNSNHFKIDQIKELSLHFQKYTRFYLKTNSIEIIDTVLKCFKNLESLTIEGLNEDDEFNFSHLDDEISSNILKLEIQLHNFGFHPDTASKLTKMMPHLIFLAIRKCSRLTSVELATLLHYLEKLVVLVINDVDSVPDQLFQTIKDHKKMLTIIHIGADFKEETVRRQFQDSKITDLSFSCNNFKILQDQEDVKFLWDVVKSKFQKI
jgi:hypothetical protein